MEPNYCAVLNQEILGRNALTDDQWISFQWPTPAIPFWTIAIRSSHPKRVSGCYVAEPRGRAVGGEPVGMATQIDLYEASLGLGIETVGGQIES